MSYPFPNGNGGDKKIFGIIMGLLCLAAVLAIAFMVWLYVFRKRKPERDPETGPKSQRKGGGESEGDEPDDGDDPPQEVTQLPPRRPRVPQPVHTADPRVKKSDPKFLRQLPEQFPQLPREVQQQIWDHAEEPNHNKHRDKAQDPCSRQLRMQLWDSLPLKDKEELYEQLDPEIQRRVKQRLRKQRLEEELAEISSESRSHPESPAASSSHSSRRAPEDASSTYSSRRAPTTVATSVNPPTEASSHTAVPGAYPITWSPPTTPIMHSRRRALSSVLTLD